MHLFHHRSAAWLRALATMATLLGLTPATASAAPPKVVRCSPDHGDNDVDPSTAVLRVEFDQDMDQGGFSVCGQDLEATGKPGWKSARVFEEPIKLKAKHKYQLSINCPSAQNFRSAAGVPAKIYPLVFRTGAAGAKPRASLKPEAKRAAIGRLRKAIDERYSYRDLRSLDWDALFARFTPRLEEAANWPKFAAVAAELLAEARDPHITLVLPGDELVGTFQREVQPNYKFAQLKDKVSDLQVHGRTAATGRFEDGIGYILIGTWGSAAADYEPVFAALKQFADAPGLVIDVRPNAGGNELVARDVAGCFLREPAVYSKSKYRDAAAPGGFKAPIDRVVSPNAKRPAVKAPTVVLMGPANMSSCESFLLMMKEAPGVTLVGEQSYGSSGNPKPHEIAGDLQVLLPSWQDLLPDGTLLEGHGVEPDLRVPTTPTDFTSGDPVLDRGLEYLRTKAAAR